jgi:hypothetical protein
MIAAFIITIIALLAVDGLTIYAAWLMISGERQEKKEIMDRWYVSKGQPPSGVDMTERHEKQEAKREEQKKLALPRADAIMKARFAGIANEPDGGYEDISN